MRTTPRSLVATAAALALLLPACGTVDPSKSAAATVDGTDIVRGDFEDMLEAYQGNAAYVAQAEASGSPLTGEAPDSLSGDFVRAQLGEAIFYAIVHEAMVDRGATVTEAARAQAEDFVVDDGADTDPDGGTFARDVFSDFPQDFQDARIQETAELVALALSAAGQDDISDAELRAHYDATPEDFTLRCISHILLSDEATALQVKAELDAGADFATEAQARSTDPSAATNAGELGCYAATDASLDATFMEAANAAEVGEVTDPVQTSFGTHLILVTELQDTYEDVADTVRGSFIGSIGADLQTVLSEAQSAAEVSVDPRYGYWDPSLMTVRPDKPSPTTVPSADDSIPVTTAAG